MKNSRWLYFFAFAVSVALIGIAGSRSFNRTVAHPAPVPEWLAAMQGKQNAIAWKRKERPVNTINSKFKLNLPSFSPNVDWVVGIKPIKEGEREKMNVGIVTWEDAVDNEGKARGLGLKKVSNIEDYPEESASITPGEASFADVLNDNQTLVIYLEVAPSTEVDVMQGGKKVILKAAEGSAVVFDGEKELVKLDGPAFLLSEMHMRKLEKEAKKAGRNLKIAKKEKTP